MRPHIVSDVGYDCITIRYNCHPLLVSKAAFSARTRTFLLFQQLSPILSQYQVIWSRTLWYLIYWLTHVTHTQWPTVWWPFWREQEQCADSGCCRDVSVWRTQISRVFPIQWFDFSINITKSRGLRIGGTSAKTHEELVAKGNTSLRCEGCTVTALVRIISYTTVSAKV